MPRQPRKADPGVLDATAAIDAYRAWLERQPLAKRTRDAYLAQVAGFLTWLATSAHGAEALADPKVRDWAVRDYKRHLKAVERWIRSVAEANSCGLAWMTSGISGLTSAA